MSELSIPAPAHDTQAPGSLPRRLVEVFVAPIALFRRFGPQAPWVGAMLVAVAVTVAAYALIPSEVWVQSTRAALAGAQGADVPEMSVDGMAGVQRWVSIGAALVAPWIMLFIQSGILLVIFTMLMGGDATYRQYLAVGAHAAIVGAVGQLATLPLIIAQGDVQASISLRALVPGTEGFLPEFLGVFNVFVVWQVVLLALGAAAINRRTSAGSAFAILFGIFAAIAAVVAAFASR